MCGEREIGREWKRRMERGIGMILVWLGFVGHIRIEKSAASILLSSVGRACGC